VSQRICGLILVSFLALCATTNAQLGVDLTPEELADALYQSPFVKGRCITVRSAEGATGTIWSGTFVLAADIEGPPKFSSRREQLGVVLDGWQEREDKPAAKAGDEVHAVSLGVQKPAFKPGGDVLLCSWEKYGYFVLNVSDTQREAILKAPKASDGGAARLLYWFSYRKSEDQFFRLMADRSLVYCSVEALCQAADKIPIGEIRDGFDQSTSPVRGFYALMLGEKGDAAKDGLRFEESIKRSVADDELDTNLLIGYVQLSPIEAVKLIELELKRNPGRFRLQIATLQALRWSLAWKDSHLPRGEGLRILHSMLDDPVVNDLVVRDLRRCKDWSQSAKLEELWHRPVEDTRRLQRAGMQYLLCAQREGNPTESKQATDVLSRLRSKDPAGLQKFEAQANRLLDSESQFP
jgi:hypothetical protein